MKILQTLRQSAKGWAIGLITPLLVGFVLGKTDVMKVLYSLVYPDRDWIGGIAFPLSVVHGNQQQGRFDLILVRHSMSPTLVKVDFIRRGAAPRIDGILAGFAAHAAGNATTLTGGVNGTRVVELETPYRTLAGAGIELHGTAINDDPAYVAVAGEVTKELQDPNDLIVRTKNEERRTFILFCFATAVISIAALFVLQFKVKHPADQDLEDQQWV
jgi:hypothetical protein